MVEEARAEFGVLGPLVVRVGAHSMQLASPKHRILLARLLLDNGRPVATAALSEAIWGERQPARPRRAVQLCVTRLRSELSDASLGQLIVTCADGYAITVPSDQIDLGRFESSARAAQLAAARADLEGEAAALRMALEQWRGEPLVDVPSDLLHEQMVPRLREQWLQTLERRVECDLRLGRQAALVAELSEVTARYPLRTRLWAQLIRALDGSGRRTEALETYHRVRSHLAEELGVEPDEELRRLHASLLVGRTGDDRTPAAAIPRQLPSNVYGFVGRQSEMTRLNELVRPIQADSGSGARSIVVSGAAGVGKTALVARWARRVADQFPDGQLWVNLRGYDPDQSQPPDRVLARFLRALGVPGESVPQDLDDLCSLYRSLLDGRRMLVVLDNAGSADQVRPLLPGGPGCLVVATSRSQLPDLVAAEGAGLLDLDLLPYEDARRLLEKRTGPDRVIAQPDAVDEIIDRCAGLPLALAIVAARAAGKAHVGLDAVATDLRAAPAALDVLSTGASGTDIRTVFSWSIGAVSPDAARLFRLLGLHPGPGIAAPAAASLAGVTEQQVRALLSELTQAHLLTEHEPGRYSLHDLLGAYATELVSAAEPDIERQAATQRLLDHYLHTAAAAAGLLYQAKHGVPLDGPQIGTTPEGPTDRDEAVDWFAQEQATLLELARSGSDTYTWRLAAVLGGSLEQRGYRNEREEVALAALAAAERIDDPLAKAISHRGLARAYLRYLSFLVAGDSPSARRRSRLEEAAEHLRQATNFFVHSNDRCALADTYIDILHLHQERGQDREALEAARQALVAYTDAGDRRGQAMATNALGWQYARVGEYEQALAICERSVALLEDLGDLEDLSDAHDSLGFIHHKLGNHEAAVEWYARAIANYRSVRHQYKEAFSTIGLGDTFHTAGDITAARETWQRAHDILTELNHPDAESVDDKLAALAKKIESRRT